MSVEIDDVLQLALLTFTDDKHMEVLLKAKDSYFQMTGKVNEDDEDYELRMNLFHDWYLLDFLPQNRVQTLIRDYFLLKGQSLSTEIKEALLSPCYSYFEYLGKPKTAITLKDLLHKKKVVLSTYHQPIGMLEGDIFIGRVVTYKNESYLLNGRCILPKIIKASLVKKCNEIRRSKEINKETEFLLKLEKHKTTYSRYGHIDPLKIFTF